MGVQATSTNLTTQRAACPPNIFASGAVSCQPHPMSFDTLLILTYGRSGSTLLQGILNSAEGVCIRGENDLALLGLYRSYQAIVASKDRFSANSENPTHPWYGAHLLEPHTYARALGESFRQHVLRPPPSTTMIGFKEIRYGFLTENDFIGLVEFCRSAFSRPAFIVNTREMEAVIASNEKAGHQVTPDQLRHSDAILRNFAATGRDDVHHVHYDDYIKDAARLEAMINFLKLDLKVVQVEEVMKQQHSTFG